MTLSNRHLSEQVSKRIILDAGVIYKNVKFEDGAFTAGEFLGATQGGNEFLLENEVRQIAVDGVKGSFKGLKVKETCAPKLKVNLLELTAKNLAMAIAGSHLDTDSSDVYDIITGKNCISLDEYIDNIAFVTKYGACCGDNSGKPVVILIENVLQIDSLSMKTTDKGEVVIPLTFEGHYDVDNVMNGTAPYAIYMPKEVTVKPDEVTTLTP